MCPKNYLFFIPTNFLPQLFDICTQIYLPYLWLFATLPAHYLTLALTPSTISHCISGASPSMAQFNRQQHCSQSFLSSEWGRRCSCLLCSLSRCCPPFYVSWLAYLPLAMLSCPTMPIMRWGGASTSPSPTLLICPRNGWRHEKQLFHNFDQFSIEIPPKYNHNQPYLLKWWTTLITGNFKWRWRNMCGAS